MQKKITNLRKPFEKHSIGKHPFDKQPFRGEFEKLYGKMNNNTKGFKGLKIKSIETYYLSDE